MSADESRVGHPALRPRGGGDQGTQGHGPGGVAAVECGAHPVPRGVPQPDSGDRELDLELDARGNVKAPDTSYQTNISKIFTAGDMRRGQSLVVWAISEGRECARRVDSFLMGSSLLESRDASLISL